MRLAFNIHRISKFTSISMEVIDSKDLFHPKDVADLDIEFTGKKKWLEQQEEKFLKSFKEDVMKRNSNWENFSGTFPPLKIIPTKKELRNIDSIAEEDQHLCVEEKQNNPIIIDCSDIYDIMDKQTKK